MGFLIEFGNETYDVGLGDTSVGKPINLERGVTRLNDSLVFEDTISSDIIERMLPQVKWSREPTYDDDTEAIQNGAHMLLGFDDEFIYIHIRSQDSYECGLYEDGITDIEINSPKKAKEYLNAISIDRLIKIKQTEYNLGTYLKLCLLEYAHYVSTYNDEINSILKIHDKIVKRLKRKKK